MESEEWHLEILVSGVLHKLEREVVSGMTEVGETEILLNQIFQSGFMLFCDGASEYHTQVLSVDITQNHMS